MKIAGVELESFPTTYRGKYVRGYRLKMPSYWRLVMRGEMIIATDEAWAWGIGPWTPVNFWSAGSKYTHEQCHMHRRYVRGRG